MIRFTSDYPVGGVNYKAGQTRNFDSATETALIGAKVAVLANESSVADSAASALKSDPKTGGADAAALAAITASGVPNSTMGLMIPNPNIPGDIDAVYAAALASSTPTLIYHWPNANYHPKGMLVQDYFRTTVQGNGSIIDNQNITYGPILQLNYNGPATVGNVARYSKSHSTRDLRVVDVQNGAAGTVGIFINGNAVGNAPRPTLSNVVTYGFETGWMTRDRFYLGKMTDCEAYNASAYGFWHQAGADAGESVVWDHGVMDNNTCCIRCDDDSVELTLGATSRDYSQQEVLVLNTAKISFTGVSHSEHRGKNLITDNGNYILNGSGNDPRAPYQGFTTWTDGQRVYCYPPNTSTSTTVTFTPANTPQITLKKYVGATTLGSPVTSLAVGDIQKNVPFEFIYDAANACGCVIPRSFYNVPLAVNPGGTANAITCDQFVTRDCLWDWDGPGTIVDFGPSSTHNVNDSGGGQPYNAIFRYMKLRNKGVRVGGKLFIINNQNGVDHFWDGPVGATCDLEILTRQNSDPTNLQMMTDLVQYNSFPDMDFSKALGAGALWYIRRGFQDPNTTGTRYNDNGGATNNGNLSIVTPAVGNSSFTAGIVPIDNEMGLMTVTGTPTAPIIPDMLITTGAAAGTRIVGPTTYGNTGAGTFMVRGAQTVAPGTAMVASVGKALQITKSVTDTTTTGHLSVSCLIPVQVARRYGVRIAYLIPSTGGYTAGTFNPSVQFVRACPDNTASGVPQIIDTWTTYASATLNAASVTKDVWNVQVLKAFGTEAECPPGATHLMFDVNNQGISTIGTILWAKPRASRF